MGKRLDFKICLAGRVQISTGACTSEVGDSNLVGWVSTQPRPFLCLTLPPPPSPTVGRNIVALSLLSPLLASSLESVVAQAQSLRWRIHIQVLIPQY